MAGVGLRPVLDHRVFVPLRGLEGFVFLVAAVLPPAGVALGTPVRRRQRQDVDQFPLEPGQVCEEDDDL